MGSAPIELIFAVLFLYNLLDWASLVGVAMMVVSIAVPGLTAKVLASIQIRARYTEFILYRIRHLVLIRI